jgi:hypothetical protein
MTCVGTTGRQLSPHIQIKNPTAIFEPLRMEAYRLREAGDLQGFRALAFLANIAALHPDYSQPGNPYEPPWQPPQQLSGHGLDAFESIIDEIKDPEFRARVGDVLWEFRRRPKAAATAVRSLIESAQRLESLEHWPLFTQRLERALTLSAKLGHAKPLHVEVLKQVESLILKYKNVKEAGFLCAELIEMLARQKRLDSAAYATVTRELAELFTAAEKWNQAHEYWKLCAKFSAGGDSKDALIRGAECWVRKAEANLSGEKPDQLFAAHWMGMAFQELQQAGASEERKREVHRRFRELQTLGMQQMAPVKLSPDVERMIGGIQNDVGRLPGIVVESSAWNSYDGRRLAAAGCISGVARVCVDYCNRVFSAASDCDIERAGSRIECHKQWIRAYSQRGDRRASRKIR